MSDAGVARGGMRWREVGSSVASGYVGGGRMNAATETHYRVKELAELWGFAPNTIKRLFAFEPGVIRIGGAGIERRRYVSISIPESVALRVHERLGKESFQPALARRNPLRVIRFRDLNGRVSQKPRNVLKEHSGVQTANGESIP